MMGAMPTRETDRATAPRRSPLSYACAEPVERRCWRAKLRPPPPRARPDPPATLVDQMLAREAEPVVAVVAPPGYGKTTLLAEWASRQARDVAWVSIDEGDNDPSVLLAATAMAVSRVQPIDPDVLDAVQRPHHAAPRRRRRSDVGLRPGDDDDVGAWTTSNRSSTPSRSTSSPRSSGTSRSAPASPTRPASPLPLPDSALAVARGAVVEIGSADLAMDRREAQELLAAAGATLTPDEIDDLYAQTEGWPAGLYLAGLASKGRRPAAEAFAFRGDDVLMGDYLRTEILSHLPASTVSFLTRTSRAGAVVRGAVRRRARRRRFPDDARARSNRRACCWSRSTGTAPGTATTGSSATSWRPSSHGANPPSSPTLHRRAATWLEGHGMPEPAIRHAQRSGDAELVVRLIAAATQPAFAAGRAADVRGWLEWFRDEGMIDQHPHVAVLGALVEALSGRRRERRAVDGVPPRPPRPPRPPPTTATTFTGRSPTSAASCAATASPPCAADARLAQERLGPQRRLARRRHAVRGALAPARRRPGARRPQPRPRLRRGHVRRGDDGRGVGDGVPARCSPCVARSGTTPSGSPIGRCRMLEAGHHQDYIEAAVVYAAAAQTAIHLGDSAPRAGHLARAARVRPLLTYAVPGASALMQLEIARAYLQLADPVGARTVLREVRDILSQRPDLGIVAREADELHQTLDAIRQSPVGASSLTAAELRLLPFLATHLSFPEIGERLHVSRHTVKTQAISVYRKFGVSSRSEAIQCAHDVGLLGH